MDDIKIVIDGEEQAPGCFRKKTRFGIKSRRLPVILGICGIFLVLVGFGAGWYWGYHRSYHDGYEKGFYIGGDLGYNEGFAQGLRDAETVAPTETATADDDTTVYILGNGRKYHAADCSVVRKSDAATAITLKEAKALDYTPCSRCLKK